MTTTAAEHALPDHGSPTGRRSRVLSVLAALALAALVLQVPVRLWVAEPLGVRTGSMAPTLRPGERVLTVKAGLDRHRWRRGEVVSFRHGRQVWVKRVVAVAGDRIGLDDGRLVVDGAVVREPWSDPSRIDGVFYGPTTVPAGSVFVLGDDRRGSIDSRRIGAVPVSAITGRVVAVLWPPAEIGGLPGAYDGGRAR